MSETHGHRWTAWVPSPLSETLGVERQRRECPCGVMQDEPIEAPDTALGRCPAMIQCHRETGHHGGHEAREPG